ncbi:MAG: hypothetical protein ABIZ64_00610 [Casimicrobium sp.]
MASKPEPTSNRVGAASGIAVAVLSVAYVVVLVAGLVTLPSPDQQIQDPWFTAMEILILAIAPSMVAFTVFLHALAMPHRKSAALLGVVFMSMCAALTSSNHFAVLTLSRQTEFADAPWAALVFSFTWPSVVYALDILAWDVFFPLGALFAALSLPASAGYRLARWLLFGSAALAFVGLAGIPLANMNVRNIGIIGYAVLFPIAAALLAVRLRHAAARGDATHLL